jgi:hypothetical protein
MALAGGALLGAGILAVALADSPARPGTAPAPEPPSIAAPAPAQPAPPLPAPRPPGARVDWEQRIAAACRRLNVAGVTAELLRARRRPDLAANVEERMAADVAALREAVDHLRDERGACLVPDHMIPGDRLTFIDGTALAPLPPDERDRVLADWITSRLRAGLMSQVAVRRADADVGLVMNFPECGPELRDIARAADVPRPADTPIASDVLRDMSAELAAVHPYYRGADGARIERILAAGKADPDDVEWIRMRLAQLTRVADEERAGFLAHAAALERKIAECAPHDAVHLADGRRIEGKIVEETESRVVVEIAIGTSGRARATYKREDVRDIKRGAGAASGFPARLAKATDAAGLVALMTWCRERRLTSHLEMTCWSLLAVDPSHEAARRELGFRRTPEGLWTNAPPPKPQGAPLTSPPR